MNAVRALRESRGWTQEELAARAGVAARTIHALEVGAICQVKTQRRILLALGLSWEERDLVFKEAPEASSGGHRRAAQCSTGNGCKLRVVARA